ncbi:hypothetical protein [Paraburkholderia sp. J41]|uniref:hypothetical protein n=1 Tax=Paraburkholderia sp. J41 TaxID=2805433 RepID=UPI002AC354D1|nr:hypothetical protein [Paraburkholderia sp. J41]
MGIQQRFLYFCARFPIIFCSALYAPHSASFTLGPTRPAAFPELRNSRQKSPVAPPIKRFRVTRFNRAMVAIVSVWKALAIRTGAPLHSPFTDHAVSNFALISRKRLSRSRCF